jgi:hypothetical protein
MKKNIFFYGNCQTGAIKDIIINSIFNYNIIVVPCFGDIVSKEKFLSYIKQADIIITQPIHPNYRETDYLHTEFILENANPNTKIIIFPSLYFNFYYFDYGYKYLKNNELLREPADYHYYGLIECHLNKKPVENFINDYVNNINLKSKFELEDIANDSIHELIKRENEMQNYKNICDCFIITCSDFISNNYKNKLLFFSVNHPTKFVFHDIAIKIINYLNLPEKIDYSIDPLYFNQRGILYKCIQNVVNFNLDNSEHKPHLYDYKLENSIDIIQKYYDTYNNIDLKSNL